MFAYRSPVIRRLKLNDVHPACVSVSLSPVVAEQGGDACQALMMLYFMAGLKIQRQNLNGLLSHLEVCETHSVGWFD